MVRGYGAKLCPPAHPSSCTPAAASRRAREGGSALTRPCDYGGDEDPALALTPPTGG